MDVPTASPSSGVITADSFALIFTLDAVVSNGNLDVLGARVTDRPMAQGAGPSVALPERQ